MRLINTRTLSLEDYFEAQRPEYAILSHTWGKSEASLKDWEALLSTAPADGDADEHQTWRESIKEEKFAKILNACGKALAGNIEFIWIDTCCIDKSSSAELSEAINSMFQWYRDAKICYAYLCDVEMERPIGALETDFLEDFKKSRWFTRGWTLQELIAPKVLWFYEKSWRAIGTKVSLMEQISDASGIRMVYLSGVPDALSHACVAEKLSWAAHRQTTRLEDEAYCLLGLLDVNMPLLYGEGRKAFKRLQEEVIKNVEDQTIFAWGLESEDATEDSGFLADSTGDFENSGDVVRSGLYQTKNSYQMSNRGLQIVLSELQRADDASSVSGNNEFVVLIGARKRYHPSSVLAIPLLSIPDTSKDAKTVECVRNGSSRPFWVHFKFGATQPMSPVSLTVKDFKKGRANSPVQFHGFEIAQQFSSPGGPSLQLVQIYPNNFWDPGRSVIVGPDVGYSAEALQWYVAVQFRVDCDLGSPPSRSGILFSGHDIALFLSRDGIQDKESAEIALIPHTEGLMDFYHAYMTSGMIHHGLEEFTDGLVRIRPEMRVLQRLGQRSVTVSFTGFTKFEEKQKPLLPSRQSLSQTWSKLFTGT